MAKAEKTGEHQVTFRFDVKGNRELPMIVGELPVLPKHYWEGNGANGEPRDLGKSTLEIPLGSGPYRIKEVDAGRTIAYERVKDWWAKDLPVAKGQWNFDEIRFVYFRDRVPAFEAFKAGQLDYWRENSAKDWATALRLRRGQARAGQEGAAADRAASRRMQAFAFNIRRPQFQDPRVRQAFNLAFDFEWANKNLFYDQYTRVGSYFDNSELKATGLPQGPRARDPERGARPGAARGLHRRNGRTPSTPRPRTRASTWARRPSCWPRPAGQPKDGVLTNAEGEQLTAEFLLVQPDFERIVLPFKAALEKLGVKASVRIVDTSQYQRRHDTFDFDIIVASFPQSLSPGNEQRDFWGSEAADKEGSRNVIGIKNPAVDKLIERIILAKDRDGPGGRHARARPRAAVEPLRRAAVAHAVRAPGDVGHVRPAGQAAVAQHAAFLRVWWYDEAAAKRLAEARG